MILYLIKTIPFLRSYYFNRAGRNFVRRKLQLVDSFLEGQKNVLDIGSGNGLVTFVLRSGGYTVTPLDIHNGAYHISVKPVIYDGAQMPFSAKQFDVGLLLTVLHHTMNQEQILNETMRVCKRIVIIEDVYGNVLQKYYTFLLDSLVNLFYSPCPHTNHSDKEWKEIFAHNGLTLLSESRRKLFGVVQKGYLLEQAGSEH